jgi:hypothetical protein
MKTKIALMKEMEAKGLSFTANVIMNGCAKPCTKMRTILKLIEAGADVRQAQFETCQVIVNGFAFWLGALDKGPEAVLNGEGMIRS